MSKYLYICCILLLVFSRIVEAQTTDRCNPVVEPTQRNVTTGSLLADLAEEYNFMLSFPKSLDQPVQVGEKMTLDQLVNMLTKGMNTVLRHEKIEGCSSLKLSEITVMPVGKETEFINVEQKPTGQPLEYLYIENMEQYVTEVLMRERKANVKKMTPEQAVEFKQVKKRLRKELRDDIKLAQKNRSKSKRKEKKLRETKGASDGSSGM
jgi:hypothetical protein